jgi:hypothetical protein
MLWDHGLHGAARNAAAHFSAPASGREAFKTAAALLELGLREDALLVLRTHLDQFFDSISPWVLYAQLLLENGNREGLRAISSRLQRSAQPLASFTAAIDVYVNPGSKSLKALAANLNAISAGQYSSIWYFAVQALIASGNADQALDALRKIEPFHLSDIDFYDRLFAAAESAKDAGSMHRAAERRYQIAPNDLFSIGNYAAMLTMFDEEPETAVKLAEACENKQPDSPSAKINHAAALINNDRFGSADLILRKIDENGIPPQARNQLHFIKIKRAVKLHLSEEARALCHKLNRSALYSQQIKWLAEQNL